MASRSTNTLQELLQRFLADLGQFKMVASEADLASAVELETGILSLARKPIENMAEQGMTNAPPQGNMGAPQPTPGPGPRMAMPSADELQRVLGGAQ